MEADYRRYWKILDYIQKQKKELEEPTQPQNSTAEKRHGFKLGAL